jgi:hypothetical protein
MAKKDQAETSAAYETSDPATTASDPPAAEKPRPPQGITLRYSSKPHPRHRNVNVIDPACLGEEVFLALPIMDKGREGEVRIRAFAAADAAKLLTCDPATGGASVYRLATDAEVAELRKYHEALKANRGRPLPQ